MHIWMYKNYITIQPSCPSQNMLIEVGYLSCRKNNEDNWTTLSNTNNSWFNSIRFRGTTSIKWFLARDVEEQIAQNFSKQFPKHVVEEVEEQVPCQSCKENMNNLLRVMFWLT